MEAKEFKEKFKAGDRICDSKWTEGFVEILYIGDTRFFGINSNGFEGSLDFIKQDWQHYKEPVKKDLEGVEKLVLIYKGKKGIRIDVINCDKTYSDFLRSTLTKDQEIITIEEAIERGLKL